MKAFHSPRLGAILLLALAAAEWSQASQPTTTPLAVMTVTGPVAIGKLGLVLAHEHVMSTCWAEPAAGPTLRRCGGHRGLLSHDGNLHPAPGARPRSFDWLLREGRAALSAAGFTPADWRLMTVDRPSPTRSASASGNRAARCALRRTPRR